MQHRIQAVCATLCLLAGTACWGFYSADAPETDDLKRLEHDFVPPRTLEMSEEMRLNDSGLAAWTYGETGVLKSVRIAGFEMYNDGEPVDNVIDDPQFLELVDQAIGTFRRPAHSDFSNDRGGLLCGRSLGVIVLNMEDTKVLIGITGCSFYYGTRNGTSHQMFYNWLLAKIVDDHLREHAKASFDEKIFSMLSGEYWFESQREAYHNFRKEHPVKERVPKLKSRKPSDDETSEPSRRIDMDKLTHFDSNIALKELEFAITQSAYNEIQLCWLTSHNTAVRKAALRYLLHFETEFLSSYVDQIKAIARDRDGRLKEIEEVAKELEKRDEPK
ncbi:MAG: hypothetical protein WEB58_18155 [Planctomycetaceae bacterium]